MKSHSAAPVAARLMVPPQTHTSRLRDDLIHFTLHLPPSKFVSALRPPATPVFLQIFPDTPQQLFFFFLSPTDPDVRMHDYLGRSCFMEVLAALNFYSLSLFQRADNTIKSISPRSAGRGEQKTHAFIIRRVKSRIVYCVPQFSAGWEGAWGGHNVHAVITWPLVQGGREIFQKMLLACRDAEINEKAAVNLSRF